MHIAFFLPNLDVGGAEHAAVNLIVGCVKRGVRVDLVAANATGEYMAKVPPEVRVIDLKSKRVLSSIPALRRYLKQERPDVIISVMDHTNLIAIWARALARVPTRLIALIQKDHQGYLQHNPTRKDRLILKLGAYFYRWADRIVTVSRGAAESAAITLSIPVENIQVLPSVIVFPELFVKAQEAIEHPWFAEKMPPVILGVGRLDPFKDFPTLIKAFARVYEQQAAHLLILGEGKERPHLQALIDELGLTEQVQMPGFSANPFAYMRRAGVFVLSSVSEALPGVLIEAMACGCPVVSTDCPSGPAEILEDGHYGPLVKMGDVEGLAKAIVTRLAQARNSEVLQNRANDFSADTITDQFLALVAGVLSTTKESA